MAEIEQSRFRNGSGRARDCDHSLLVGARWRTRRDRRWQCAFFAAGLDFSSD